MESNIHIELVRKIIEYVEKRIPEANYKLIQSDSNGNNSTIRVIGDYIPDVYYRYENLLVIGEAKTLNDFDKIHSREQFSAYLSELQLFDGDKQLIIAVPWQLTISVKNYFRRIKKNDDLKVTIVIINEWGKEMTI